MFTPQEEPDDVDTGRVARAAGKLLNVRKNNQPDPWSSIAALSPDDLEAMMENFANEDTNASKTWSRVVVEKFLMKQQWYFPRKDVPNAPSLSKAYAYYEHISLPRHFAGQQTATHVMRRAEPGETEKTELYHPFTTRASNFIEWGIGVDLYFSTLRIMAGVLFIAGLCHLPNQIFYRSSEYSPVPKTGIGISLLGSALCATSEWVACSGCKSDFWDTFDELTRFGTVDIGEEITVVQRLTCKWGELTQGFLNWAVLFLLTGILLLLGLYLAAREVRFDEDKVTSTDYTLIVKNPPPDAYDPDEWRDFFAQFGNKDKNVTAVTIALDNELMLQLLIARRTHRNTLRLMLPKGIDMEDEDAVRVAVNDLVRERESERPGCGWRIFSVTLLPILQLFNYLLPPEVLVDRVFSLTDRIKELQKEKYSVARVFITFETEEFARTALETLSIPWIDIMMKNNTKYQHLTFKDQLLLVGEPAEPSAIRWLNLSASNVRKIMMRAINFIVTIGVVGLCGYLVTVIRFYNGQGNAWLAASTISMFNVLIPLIIKILMIFEPHSTEGGFQTSLYLKITLFRWVNTALLIKLTTPWTSTLQGSTRDVLPQINAILWSELYLVPTLRLLDLWGNFCKHFLAPRARTQEEMNLSFQGTKYNLGERYTDLTKVLFVCFFYSSLYPAAFFFGTAILIVQYFTDKYCLLRIWANSASIGSEVSRFSRRYFFSAAVVAYAVFNSYVWAGFPYSNLCEPDDPETGAAGTYTDVTLGTGEVSSETIVVEKDTFVEFCDQSWRIFTGALRFPPTSGQQPDNGVWMSDSQAMVSSVYGITAAVFVGGYIAILFGGVIMAYVKSFFCGFYKPKGQMQHIDFSSNPEIFGYIPQVKVGGFPFPFLACDIDEIDQGLIGWNDPSRSYDHWNLIFDLKWEGMKRKKIIETNTRGTGARILDHADYSENSTLHLVGSRAQRTPIFSVVKHYPPAWVLELRKKD